jgi:hypothetical protein
VYFAFLQRDRSVSRVVAEHGASQHAARGGDGAGGAAARGSGGAAADAPQRRAGTQ